MAEKRIDGKGLRFAGVVAGASLLVGGMSIGTSRYWNADASSPKAGAPRSSGGIQNEVFRNGEAGFVVTQISYALGPDGKDGACPAGMTSGVRGQMEAFGKTPAGQRQEGETDRAYGQRVSRAINTTPSGKHVCMNPEAGTPDPGWRLVSGANLKVDGIDLDGQASETGKRPAAGTCGHEDFRGADGARNVDNQFYRVVGCTTGFQSTGQANGWQTEMYTGSWGILVSLKGVDDLKNDSDVEVSIYANADPIQLSAAREALPYATYAVDQDGKYRARTRGRIVDGVLTTDPVDVRFRNVVNSMFDDRPMRDARLKLTFTPDGGMDGFMAGYTPVEAMYDLQYGARHSKTAKGEPAPERLRVQTSSGRAGALGHSCNGAYFALYQAADGHRDPSSGRCTSISTQYRIRVAPAFIVDAPTKSVNTALTGQ